MNFETPAFTKMRHDNEQLRAQLAEAQREYESELQCANDMLEESLCNNIPWEKVKCDLMRAERDAALDELSACTEHPGGCGYWREAARRREAERDAAIIQRDEYKYRLEDAIKNFAEREAGLENEMREYIEVNTRLVAERDAALELVRKLEGALGSAANEMEKHDSARLQYGARKARTALEQEGGE